MSLTPHIVTTAIATMAHGGLRSRALRVRGVFLQVGRSTDPQGECAPVADGGGRDPWPEGAGSKVPCRRHGSLRQTLVRAACTGVVLRGRQNLFPQHRPHFLRPLLGTWLSCYYSRLPPERTEAQGGEVGLLRARSSSGDQAFRLALPLDSVVLSQWLVVSLLGGQAPPNSDEITQTSVPAF